MSAPYPPGFPPPQQSSSRATTSLVLGIVSIVACGFLTGIPAMVVSRRARREIAASEGRLTGDGLAVAGFWTGLAGTVLCGLGLLAVAGVILFGATISSDFHCTSSDANGSHTVNCS